ncbi:MAG: hypothetical protein ACFCUE_05575 [Candidatus Bathyarchaeia archaeon]|jgi:hypothetical protein
MDKAILLGASLIALTFVLAITFAFIKVPYLNTFFALITIACFPIGALIVLLRIMQWAKFKLHKGTLFGVFLIGIGVTVLLTSTSYTGLLHLAFLNNHYARIAALAGTILGILILTLKTAIWGSKYIEKNGTQKTSTQQ